MNMGEAAHITAAAAGGPRYDRVSFEGRTTKLFEWHLDVPESTRSKWIPTKSISQSNYCGIGSEPLYKPRSMRLPLETRVPPDCQVKYRARSA